MSDYVRQYLFDSAARSDKAWLREFPRAAEYRWQHTLNVLRNAETILAGEAAAPEQCDIVRAAVILHDVSMFVCDHAIHGRVSAEIAERYLTQQGYAPEFVQRVARAVAEHGTDLGDLPPDEQGALFSWEGKVVLEADILDKLGASAIASDLLFRGKKDILMYESRAKLATGMVMERAAFFKDFLWSDTARRMGAQRFGFFLKFLEQLSEEVVEDTRPPEIPHA
jgi:HD superfamily phosphodiesterase